MQGSLTWCPPAVAVAATLFIAALPAPCAAAAPHVHRKAAVETPAPVAPTASSSVAGGMGEAVLSPSDRLTNALQQIGMTTCAGAVQRAAKFLFEDGDANFTVQPLGPDANRWPTVIVIEGSHAAMGKTRFSTLTVTPGPTCSGFYQQVISWPVPCAELKRTVFADFQNVRVVLRNVQVSELGPALQVYLMASGTGCVSVKKELFH